MFYDRTRTEWPRFIQLSSNAHGFLIYSFTVHSLSSTSSLVAHMWSPHRTIVGWLVGWMGIGNGKNSYTTSQAPPIYSQQYVLCPSRQCSTTIADYCSVVVCRLESDVASSRGRGGSVLEFVPVMSCRREASLCVWPNTKDIGEIVDRSEPGC